MHDSLFWLYADNYRTYNIEVAHKLDSIYAAILLSELASRYRYHRDRKELYSDPKHGDNFFYYTREDIEERTKLSRKNQDSALSILEKHGLVEKRIFGLPARRYFRLNHQKIQEFFFKENSASLPETDKLGCPKRTNCNDRNGQTAHIYKEPQDDHHNTPPTPASGEAAAPRKVVEFSPEVKEVCSKMVELLQEANPVYRPPRDPDILLKHVRLLIEYDKQSPNDILDVFQWAVNDTEQRGDFKGWQSVLSGKNPMEKFRKHFATLHAQMRSQPKRKFAPSSDNRKALAALMSMDTI